MRVSSLTALTSLTRVVMEICVFYFFLKKFCGKKRPALLAACGQSIPVELTKAGAGPTSASGITFSVVNFLRASAWLFCSLPF